MAADELTLEVGISPHLDSRAVAEVDRSMSALTTKYSKMKMEWKGIAKATQLSVKEIANITSAASDFTKKLSTATATSFKKLQELGDELESAAASAEDLKKKWKKAKGTAGETKAARAYAAAAKKVSQLNREVDNFRKSNKNAQKELEKVAKAHHNYAKSLQEAAKFSGRQLGQELSKQGGAAFRGFVSKDLRGMLGGLAGMGRGVGKAAKGALAKRALAAGAGTAAGGMGGAAGALLKIAPVISGLATSLGVLVALLAAASDHQSKLNKALLKGTGTVNDFFKDGEKYVDTIKNMRQAAMDAHGSMLEFGVNSEKMLSVVNAFATTSTGSLSKTSSFLTQIGGNLESGMKKFVTSAVAYGKALGMEAEEVATMMGNFQSEVGYSAEQSMDLMRGVVKAASMANMPVTKFMDIFKSVTPHVELFTNRIETLTGAISLLGKTMSPSQVKKFMEAFGKGLSEESFRARLKKTLVAGVGVTSKILEKDFSDKAKNFEGQLGKVGLDPKKFRKAWETGNARQFEKIMAQAEAAGLGPAQIGAMRRTFGYEQARQRGGALETATAMKGAGMWAQVKLAEAQMRRLGQLKKGRGITGISEQVAEKLGYSQQHINALNDLIALVRGQTVKITEYGTTGSKATDKALAEIALQRGLFEEGKSLQNLTRQDMKKLGQRKDFRDLLAAANEKANEDKEVDMTAEEMAKRHYNATASISEKLTNVIAYLLEKLYGVMQPLLDLLDHMWQGLASWIRGDDKEKAATAQVQKFQEGIAKSYGPGSEFTAQMKIFSDKIISAGGDPKKMGQELFSEINKAGMWGKAGVEEKFKGLLGARVGDQQKVTNEFNKHLQDYAATMEKHGKEYDPKAAADYAMQQMVDAYGDQDWAAIFMEIAQTATAKAGPSQLAKDLAAGRKQFERTTGREELQKAQTEQAKNLEDAVTDLDESSRALVVGGGTAPAAPAAPAAPGEVAAALKGKPKVPAKASKRGEGMSKEEIEYFNAFMVGAHAKKAKMPRMGTTVVDEEFRKKYPTGKPAGGDIGERLKKTLVAGTATTAAAVTGKKKSPEARATEEAQEEATREQQDATEKITLTEEQNAQKLEKATDKVYEGVDDVVTLLKKGIKLEANFVRGRYKKVVKEATLEAFRIALIEFAIIQMKLQSSEELQKFFTGPESWKAELWKLPGALTGGPLQTKRMLEMPTEGAKIGTKWKEVLGNRQQGGPIPETGLWRLHAGEYVLPPELAGRGGGATQVTNIVNVNIEDTTSPEKVGDVVVAKLGEVFGKGYA